MPKKRVTMQDVALYLGVDHSTVSLALRSDPRIPGATQDRIREAARKLNYSPNHLARALSGGRSRVIGVLLPEMRNQFFVPHLDEIQAAAERNELAVSIKFSNWDLTREDRALAQFCHSRVDGVAWAPVRRDEESAKAILDKLAAAGVKLAMIGGSYMNLPFNRVRCSDLRAVQVAADYIKRLRHPRIGLASAAVSTGNRGEHNRIRLDYMRAALTDKGLFVRDEDVFVTADDLCGGVEIAGEIGRRPPAERPTIVFAADDMLARALIAGFDLCGIKVPTDISVLGYDDAPGDASAPVAVTSVSLRGRDVGRILGQMLVDLVEGEGDAGQPQTVQLEPEIIERASCLPWRGDASSVSNPS